MFDTHAHFSKGEVEAPLANAFAAGVSEILAVGGSDELNDGVEEAAECGNTPGMPNVYRALGFDRDQAGEPGIAERAVGYVKAMKDRIAAVGELGLDYAVCDVPREQQIKLIEAELAAAGEIARPVIIHTREADDDTLAVLGGFKHTTEYPGVIHCFTGSAQFARKLLDLGYFISFSGILTFRNADPLRETAKYIPEDRLLVETDSPYLAPVPMRGNRNEPAFVVHTARLLAQLRGTSPDTIDAVTTANACRLFGL